MHSLINSVKAWWRNVSISKKLFLIVGVMTTLIVCELLTLKFSMRTLSAARAFVAGESLWSKSQKDATLRLQRYAATKSEVDYQRFLEQFKIPEAYHEARMALLKDSPDFKMAVNSLVKGEIHPEDAEAMVELLHRFHNVSYLANSVEAWKKGDELNGKIKKVAENVRSAVLSGDKGAMEAGLGEIAKISEQLTRFESRFSQELGNGSRWLEHIILTILLFAVLIVESVGLTLTFLISRSITRGLKKLNNTVDQIGKGQFQNLTADFSEDEIGQLGVAMINAARTLDKSYGDLESKVHERARELASSQDRLNVVLKGILDGVTMTDLEGRFVYVNEAAAEMCGYSNAESMMGLTMLDVASRMDICNEAGSPIPITQLPSRQLFEGVTNPPELLLSFRLKSGGTRKWALLKSASVYDEQKKTGLAVSIMRDFTEHKHAEDTLKFLDEASTILGSSVNYEETVRNISELSVPRMADICVIDILDDQGEVIETISRSKDGLNKLEALEKLRSQYPQTWRIKQLTYNLSTSNSALLFKNITPEHLRRISFDEGHYVQLMSLGLKGAMKIAIIAHGRLFGIMNLLSFDEGRQFSDRDLFIAQEVARRAGSAIDNALLFRQVKKAVEVRDEFLSIASHELKTPLTSLKLQIQNAKHSMGDPKRSPMKPERLAEVFDISDQQIKRLQGLVDDLLDASRIQAGKLGFSFERSDITTVVKDMISRYKQQFNNVGNELSVSLHGECNLSFDLVRMEQVLDNLFSNIFKYAPGVPVHVSVENISAGVRIVVADKGPGIPLEKQSVIFERFERVGSYSHHVSGLGLGLYIVNEIVKGHKGAIHLESEPGKGSCFIIDLPENPGLTPSGLALKDPPEIENRIEIS